MSVRFIHSADWQLGKPFAGIADPQKRHAVQAERFAVLDRIAALAREKNAAFIIVAGDTFDSPTPTKTSVSQFCSAVGRMERPVYLIPGNHDHGGPGGVWSQPFFQKEAASLAPNLHVLLDAEPVVAAGAVLWPCPLLRRHETKDLSDWLRNPPALPEETQSLPRIVIAHGTVLQFNGGGQFTEEDEGGGTVNHLDLARLPEAEYDYIALGDWHGHLSINARTWYAGTPEPDRFARGESNQPGYTLLVEASRSAPPLVEPIPTARLRWHELSFTFREGIGLASLQARLQELIGDRTQADLLRLHIEGALSLAEHAQLTTLRETMEARLLRLKETGSVAVAPTEEETLALTQRTGDPLTVHVASQLVHQSKDSDPAKADLARSALRALHLALRNFA